MIASATSLRIALYTVSDSRTPENDTSGDYLAQALAAAGHRLARRAIVTDDRYRLRATVSTDIADAEVDAVLLTGGTGITGRDITPEALVPLFDKTIEGFGELFRYLSFHDVKTSTIQSRAVAGVANGTLIFALPGSTGAVRLAWEEILKFQLDASHKPCNFVTLIPRLKER